MNEPIPPPQSLAKARPSTPQRATAEAPSDIPVPHGGPPTMRVGDVRDAVGVKDLTLAARFKFASTVYKIQESVLKSHGEAITRVAEMMSAGYVQLQEEKLNNFLREAAQFYSGQAVTRTTHNRNVLLGDLMSQLTQCYGEISDLESETVNSQTDKIRVEHLAEILNKKINLLDKDIDDVLAKWNIEYSVNKLIHSAPKSDVKKQ